MKKSLIAALLAGMMLLSFSGCSAAASLSSRVSDEMVIESSVSEAEAKELILGSWHDEAQMSDYLFTDDGSYIEVNGDNLYTGNWCFETAEDGYSYFHLQVSDNPEHDYAYLYSVNETQDIFELIDKETGEVVMTWNLVDRMDEQPHDGKTKDIK